MQQYHENRLSALAAQKAAGINPYPHKFETELSIPEYVKRYKSSKSEDHVEKKIAGRRCFVNFLIHAVIYMWSVIVG